MDAKATLSQYRSRLIDLSLRNKLVNYRPGRSSAVAIVDEVPRVVTERLLVDGTSFGFLPRPGENAAEGGEEHRRVATEELAPAQTDRMLQTTLTDRELARTLYNLYLKSRTSLEEQGAVTLFLAVGMLRWFESPESGEEHLAPILLLPVELARDGVGRAFALTAAHEEPQVNPSLLRKLAVDFGVEPDLPPIDDGIDPDAILDALKPVLPDPRWRVLSDMHLSLFSFSKYLMYRDIEDQADVLLANPLVSRLSGAAVEESRDAPPPEPAELDDLRPPSEVHQILDADSSQQVAIETVRRGSDLVLEGPPGTGKSQTISNLIAESLADGRTVLFVSEKMAALDVVKRRLDAAGLGDYVLELHSRHTRKRDVVTELKRCLERERVQSAPPAEELGRLVEAREMLSAYVDALHEPFGRGGLTPFQVHGTLARLADAKDVLAGLERPEDATSSERHARRRALEDLARARAAVAPRAEHPFRISRLTDVPRALEIELRRDLEELETRARALADLARGEAEVLGLPAPADAADAERIDAILAHLAASPRPEPAWLRDADWPGYAAEGRSLAAKLARYREGRAALDRVWTDGLYEIALEEIVERRRRHGTGLGRFFRPSWWRDGKLLGSVRRPGASRAPAEEIDDLERAITVRDLGAEIDRASARAGAAFGRFFAGRDTDADALDALAKWAARLRELLPGEAAPRPLAETAANPSAAAPRAKALADAIAASKETADRIRGRLRAEEPPPAGLEDRPAFARAALDRFEEIHAWSAWRRALGVARDAGLAGYLETADREGIGTDELADVFEKAFAGAWLDRARAERPVLRDFDPRRHEDAVRRFGDLDRRQLALAAARIRARLDRDLPASRSFSPDSDVGLLLREAAKKRRHLPLRQLLTRAESSVRRLKPCFMMSPLSIARFLPPGSEPFDLVVFDEASQICPEDAIGALARGRRAVVVGDSRQLPPTTFFAYDPDVEADAADDEVAPDLESILDLCVAQGFPRLRLRWHYRSRDESLIAFSNDHFYDGSLFTFPGPGSVDGLGVRLVHVAEGVYDRGGTRTNAPEAAAVARGIADHLLARPELSVGVVTFSEAQRRAVLDEVEKLAREDSELERRLAARADEPFFVKNLENVQGDERDVMFFSVGYGPDREGKVTMNFGPLNGDGGHRRLNVAITRARSMVRVYSSILPDEIDPERARGAGARLLRAYLEYAARGAAAGDDGPETGEEPASELEAALAADLEERGFTVAPRVGCSSRRIDLALARPDDPDRFLLGIECDGPGYRDAPTARDRDRLRTQVLSRLGWRIERVWAPDFLRARHGVVDRLHEIATAEPPPPEEAPAPEPTDVDPPGVAVETEEPLTLPEVDPWRPTPPSKRRPRGAFSEKSAEVRKIALAVVAHEGPVHEEEVARRVADSFATRLTAKVRDAVYAALVDAVSKAEIVRDGEFLRLPEQRETVVRGAAPDGSTRAIEHVPPAEIAAAAFLVLEIDLRLPREALEKAVTRVLGYRRRTNGVSERIGGVLDDLLAAGRIVEDEGMLSPAPGEESPA